MECVVCCEERECLKFSCKHSVCKVCFIKTAMETCPFCRKNVINDVDDDTRELTRFIIESNKKLSATEEELSEAIDDANHAEDEMDIVYEKYMEMRRKYINLRVSLRASKKPSTSLIYHKKQQDQLKALKKLEIKLLETIVIKESE